MKQFISPLLKIGLCPIVCLYSISEIANAQVIPDGTVNTQVNQAGNVSEITGGETRDSNLFHSFQEFSVGTGNEAFFKNIDTIENIFSRVTGGNISNIDGLIRANSANLFLLNPAGIIFGPNARLDIGGSFIGTTADSILFSDGTEFSATDTQAQPTLTINAPIGLNFRDNPGEVVNRSVVTDDTGENSIGLRVLTDETLALIGGNVLIEGGLLTTEGGRIELGSVAENSTVSINPVEKGFDFGYEEVTNFQDISLSSDALVESSEANTGDIEVQGRNISLIEDSSIEITTSDGQPGDLNIIATESLTLDLINFTGISSNVIGNATGEGSVVNINTPKLTMNSAILGGSNLEGTGQGVDVNINASEIIATTSLIFAQVEEGSGNGGNITITTEKLTLNEGAQINASTFTPGNAGNINVIASESIELNGTIPDSNIPSGIIASVEDTGFGNGGDVIVTTPRLVVSDGAQIASSARNDGNGGNITINASDSIQITGASPLAQLEGEGISAIAANVEPTEMIPSTGNGGDVTVNTGKLIIEQGASISVETFSLGDGGNANINVNQLIVRDGGQIVASSLFGVDPLDTERGNGGTLNIDATESVEVTGIGDVNGTPVESRLFTLAESNGDAGDLTLTTGNLTVSDGGEIDASTEGEGTAGSINIKGNSINLTNGRITASTNAGDGGNITLDIDENLTLRDNSLISAQATSDADGGNVNINSQFIIAFPSEPPGDGNDIVADAVGGMGGNITINAESLFGIEEQPAMEGNGTNDIDVSSEFSFDGTVNINSSDINPIQGVAELPQNIVVPEQTAAQACRANRELAAQSGFTISGKGGVPASPELPLSSQNIVINDEISSSRSTIPQAIQTSQGEIQPARGIKVTESGGIILTAYRTNNTGERIPEGSINCGQV